MSNIGSENQGCLFTLLEIFGIKPKSWTKNRSLPYCQRDDFLTAAEISFYHVIKSYVGERATVCPKVNLADIFFVVDRRENFAFVGRINQKHIDFVLCDPNTMRPILGIELDDSSHKRANRQERDAFVDRVFKTANLPLVRVPARNAYKINELSLIDQYIASGLARPIAQESEPRMPTIDVASPVPPICQKCNVSLVIRTASKGEKRGEQFWGCPNYPRCKTKVPLE